MNRQTIIAAFMALVVLGGQSALAQSGYDLFQKGLVQERAKGDLEEAIGFYQQIVEDHKDDRALAAKALVQMGQCYENLGRTEARKAYERVLREFADQPESVQIARRNLEQLEDGTTESDVGNTGIVFRKVLPELPLRAGRPSPDGRYILLRDPNVKFRDLTTGEVRRLTNDGTWAMFRPHRSCEGNIWSPDSRHIAYGWRHEDHWELRIVGLDGSEPRVLYANEDVLALSPSDWSEDGEFIAGELNRPDGTREIVLFSVADGSVRKLNSFKDDWRYKPNWQMSLSPDGRYLVYDRRVTENNGFRGIFLLSTDGHGKEVSLVRHAHGDDCFPLWAPDGRTIAFQRDDPFGKGSLWLTEVLDGQPAGIPRLFMRGREAMIPLGFTREGSLYVGVHYPPPRASVYIASWDAGGLMSQPTRLPSGDDNYEPSWSPDGK